MISFIANFIVRVSLLVDFKENFEMKNTSVGSSSQQTSNKLNFDPLKPIYYKGFLKG